MGTLVSADRIRFLLNRFRQRLWVKPLAVCLLSIAAAFVAKLADGTVVAEFAPNITKDSIESLLSIMAASMLVIATFSVGSMVSAYASAGNTATPRSFGLVVADDASQNALSTFVGSFIFSIVALMAAKNDFFEKAGLLILFLLTALVFALVIVTFVRWVDSIARLGRMGSTIRRVEAATAEAMRRRRLQPHLGGRPLQADPAGHAVFAASVGYVQHIDIATLQNWAEQNKVRVTVVALPGTFATPDRALAYVSSHPQGGKEVDVQAVVESFQIGVDRLFDDDPRFGLVVLSEIAGRALSPAVNDPGTAIDIIGTLVRLFVLWSDTESDSDAAEAPCDRVEVIEISANDMFDDAFATIARDGAALVEVAVRLQKALQSLARIDDPQIRAAAQYHSRLALARSELAMNMAEDKAALQAVVNSADD